MRLRIWSCFVFYLVFSFLALLQIADSAIDLIYRDRILPGIEMAGIKVGGLTREGAWALLAPRLASAAETPLVFHHGSFKLTQTPANLGFSSDRETALFPAFESNRLLLPLRIKGKLLALAGNISLPVGWKVDSARLSQLVENSLAPSLERETRDAQLELKNREVQLKPAVVGAIIDRRLLQARLEEYLGKLQSEPILIPVIEKEPAISNDEALKAQNIITNQLTRPITLKAGFDNFLLNEERLWEMVKIVSDNGKLKTELDDTKLLGYLREIESKVNQELQSARLVIKDGRAIEFVPPRDRVRLLVNESLEKIKRVSVVTSEVEKEVELAREIKSPEISLAATNDLGINTLVARGTSNFKGSPPNRRHNIRVGMERFNGVIVEPGETFSFIKALGRVDASTGYRPELVIKGDETIPEFGGGLCQVSTTAFRAILNGGYPVVERQNHSYRVIYYEPAGSDATIYPPRPDLKFTNDTPGAILIHTYLKGDDAYFDFYGTALPRKVVLDGPYILKTTSYSAPVYIETSSLPPGVIKQVDIAHRGADTVLYRYLYNETGTLLRKDTFKSHYIPWPAKFLVGKIEAPQVPTDLKQAPPVSEQKEEASVPLR